MGKKTINQALKDLFLGLGGDSSALADNSSVSDYIEDLESAIKGAASGELPEVTAEDIGDVLAVVSDGESGAQWGKGEIPSELPSVEAADIGEALIVESDGEGGAQWGKGTISVPQEITIFDGTISGSTFTLTGDYTKQDVKTAIESYKPVALRVTNGVPNKIYGTLFLYCGADKARINMYFANIAATENNSISFTSLYAGLGSGLTAKTFTVVQNELPLLPAVTSSDNDKILKVVNGVWTAVTP